MSSSSSLSLPADFQLRVIRNEADGSGRTRSFPERVGDEAIPPIKSGLAVPNILGNGALIKFTHDGGDVSNVFQWCAEQVRRYPNDGSYLLDLALLHLIQGRPDEAYRAEARALEMQQLFRVVGSKGEEVATRRRILALVAPGDFMNRAQLEFIVDGSDIGLDLLYLVPGKPLPPVLPEHDVLFCALNESDDVRPVLNRLASLLPVWPRPVLNGSGEIQSLSRDGIAALFENDPHIRVPKVRRVNRSHLHRLALGEVLLDSLLPSSSFPVLARPVGTHGGKDFERIDTARDVESYLRALELHEGDFFLSSFVNYRSADGLFRKYRVILIDGTPLLCHMAPSEQWKIHYVNAGMDQCATKRADEARAMETFDQDFARRHKTAFATLHQRLGLDFLGIDCAESPDGRLLIFEAETALLVHNLDSPTVYPYKQPQMAKVFRAFGAMIERAAVGQPGTAVN